MAREIRITIDDDEVFERMKARKRELDLSWREVLRRGLRRDPPGMGPHGPSPDEFDFGPGREVGPGGAFAEELESRIRSEMYDSLRSGFGAAGIDVPDPMGGLDDAVSDLEAAEDATLAFPFLDDDPRFEVPLRVNLHARAGALDVEVVAVRQGKTVDGLNAFDAGMRRRLVERLAGGDLAVLRLADGAEEYSVRPALSWSRDRDGNPTVVDAEIEEVVFDDAD